MRPEVDAPKPLNLDAWRDGVRKQERIPVTDIRISFENTDGARRRVKVLEHPRLPEHEQIWVWGLCYAQILNQLGEISVADQLRETLDGWAVQMASKMFLPLPKIHGAGLLVIDPALSVTDQRDVLTENECTLSTHIVPGRDWPGIQLQTPDVLTAARRADLAVGLAQYFLLQNKLFLKELPVHLMAYRKFYTDVMPPGDPASREQAPLYALSKSLELYESMRKTFDRQQEQSR